MWIKVLFFNPSLIHKILTPPLGTSGSKNLVFGDLGKLTLEILKEEQGTAEVGSNTVLKQPMNYNTRDRS